MLFYTLYEIVGYLISIIVMVVIVQFVLSLLISFNVVNLHNQFVEAIWQRGERHPRTDPGADPAAHARYRRGRSFPDGTDHRADQIVQIVLKNMAVAML